MDDAVQTVMMQCELWTDNYSFDKDEKVNSYTSQMMENLPLVAEESTYQ